MRARPGAVMQAFGRRGGKCWENWLQECLRVRRRRDFYGCGATRMGLVMRAARARLCPRLLQAGLVLARVCGHFRGLGLYLQVVRYSGKACVHVRAFC